MGREAIFPQGAFRAMEGFDFHAERPNRGRWHGVAPANEPANSSSIGATDPTLEMECIICFMTLPHSVFISAKGCNHRFCFGCCQRYAEEKVATAESSEIACPCAPCPRTFDVHQCRALLSQPSFELLTARQTEAAIPSSQPVFCAYPDCSVQMQRCESGDWTRPSAECLTCRRAFCLDCSTPWLTGHSCAQFQAEDVKPLQDLARAKGWRSCAACKRVVERLYGCNCMTCLCGFKFCYKCGEKWDHRRMVCGCYASANPGFARNVMATRVGAERTAGVVARPVERPSPEVLRAMRMRMIMLIRNQARLPSTPGQSNLSLDRIRELYYNSFDATKRPNQE